MRISPTRMTSPHGHRCASRSIGLVCLPLLLIAGWSLISLLRSRHEQARPTDYTEDSFSQALRERLGAEEIGLVSNPLSSSPKMETWAREITADATSDLQKARMLFDVLVSHISAQPAGFARPPTAKEIFEVWNTPGASFRCQEFSFLYVSLARAVGLKAYHVCVAEDCRGVKVSHGCAAVFVTDKPLLIDLTYSLFGAGHRRFRVLDDPRTTALYLCGGRDVRLCQIAAKLAPDLPIVRASLFEMLAFGDRWGEAQSELSELIRLDPEGPLTYASRARIAAHSGKMEEAAQLLRRAVELAPETGHLHFSLGSIYAAQGRWSEAGTCYENAARLAVYENAASTARGALAFIEAQQQQARGDLEKALTNYDRAIECRPDYFQAYFWRARTRETRGELGGAASDYEQTVELKRDIAEVYIGRGNIKYGKGDFDGALTDYNKALSLNPGLAFAFGKIGCVYYDRHEFNEALVAFRKACEGLWPPDDYTHFFICLARSRMGEPEAAVKELRDYLERSSRGMGADWRIKVGEFLTDQITESALFGAAESPDERINA